MKKLLLLTLLAFGFTDCPDGYTLNPLFSEGDDSFEECVPSEFIHYISPQQAAYLFINVLINEENITSEDWVGAFNGDVCVGSRKWDISQCGQGVCDIMLYGVNGSGLTNGYMSFGDIPVFKIFEASSGEYYPAYPSENNLWASNSAFVEEILQACSGGSLDLDNDDICDEFDDCIGNQYDECGVCDGDNTSCEIVDLNGDGTMNLLDIVLLVNLVLGSGDYNSTADVNEDGINSILDIVILVNLVFNP